MHKALGSIAAARANEHTVNDNIKDHQHAYASVNVGNKQRKEQKHKISVPLRTFTEECVLEVTIPRQWWCFKAQPGMSALFHLKI